MRRMRSLAGHESGAVSAGALIGLAIVAGIVYVMVGAFNGNIDQYGTMAIPGTSAVELPGGQTNIYYLEHVAIDAGLFRGVPQDLRVIATTQAGLGVRVDPRSGDTLDEGDSTARLFATVTTPGDGLYNVEVSSAQAATSAAQPQVTFGQSPFEAIGDRFTNVVDVARGPAGIGAIVLLVLVLVLPTVQRAREPKESDSFGA